MGFIEEAKSKYKKDKSEKLGSITNSDAACVLAANRLKMGPPNVPKIIEEGKQWKDESFSGTDMIYWDTGVTSTRSWYYSSLLKDLTAGIEIADWSTRI